MILAFEDVELGSSFVSVIIDEKKIGHSRNVRAIKNNAFLENFYSKKNKSFI